MIICKTKKICSACLGTVEFDVSTQSPRPLLFNAYPPTGINLPLIGLIGCGRGGSLVIEFVADLFDLSIQYLHLDISA